MNMEASSSRFQRLGTDVDHFSSRSCHGFGNPILAALGVLIVLLCGSTTASAQDGEGRVVAVLDVTGKKASSIQGEFRSIFDNTQHILYSESELGDAGRRVGVTQERFWEDIELMKKVANAEPVDAIVAADLQLSKKRYTLNVYVFDARTGATVGDFAIELGKKVRLSSSAKDQLRKDIDWLLQQTGGPPPPIIQSIRVTITSIPVGATVMRNNEVLGKTPLSIDIDSLDSKEIWKLTYNDTPAGEVIVDLSRDGQYEVVLAEEAVEKDEPGFVSDIPSGSGRPLLEVDVGVTLTKRSTNVEVLASDGYQMENSISYNSALFPVYALDLTFFPMQLLSNSDILSGIGLTVSAGYGSLLSRIPLHENAPALAEASTCSIIGNLLAECPSTQTQFDVGGTFLWMFNTDADGRRDPNGMLLGFDVAYSWLVFGIDDNPTYVGHGYQSLRFGADWSMPLGLPELRLDANFSFLMPLSFGEARMIELWGTSASGWGLGGSLDVSYELWKGLFASVGYSPTYYTTSYGGVGCLPRSGDTCKDTEKSVATDFYHQLNIDVGYRFK
ncbi:MAG: hypothetical protein AUK47_25965 [Deltaproteobacteria bacterium CG2_30_63_29]|nr:MAG: hypothetical protein AUK47_25965 [Deltaproteobacteria bacterium CG2_30_63_29]